MASTKQGFASHALITLGNIPDVIPECGWREFLFQWILLTQRLTATQLETQLPQLFSVVGVFAFGPVLRVS